MTETTQSKARYLIMALLIALGVLILAIAWQPMATAEDAPKPLPTDGEPVTLTINGLNLDQEPNSVAAPLNGPAVVIDEDFEGNWEQEWTNVSFNAAPYMWGDRVNPRGLAPGNNVNWAVGGGAQGKNLNANTQGYPDNVSSWLITKQPLDLSDGASIKMTFDVYVDLMPGDSFSVGTSTNGSSFLAQPLSNTNGWESYEVDLGMEKGQPKVWIAFVFTSDNQNDQGNKLGALIDNILVTTQGGTRTSLPIVMYTFTRTPDPVTPTPTTPPVTDEYLEEFDSNIDGWLERRATFGTSFELTHDGASDAGRQGFLNLKVNSDDSNYVIASPLIPIKAPPYNIETEIKLRSDRNTGDQYGIVFGANYDPSAGPCTAEANGVCFNQYYELRVRFWYDEGADKDRFSLKLNRIDGVDDRNNSIAEELFFVDKVSDTDEDDFVEWDILVESDGDIRVAANDLPVDEANDTKYINNPYFGVIVRAESEPDAEAKFDYIKID